MLRLPRSLLPRATLPSLARLSSSAAFPPRPAPPKLSAADQAEFERLQKAAAESPAFSAAATERSPDPVDVVANPAAFRGSPEEFAGDVNPKTGEVGGPKREPLRWGGSGDWSYNGKVTDF
jgi:hypothetical protein